jgi:hypothetical protein
MTTKKTITAAPEPESFDEVMKSLQRSIALAIDSPAMNMSRVINQMVDDMVKNQRQILLSISELPKITLPSTTLYFPKLSNIDTTQDIELVGGYDVVSDPVKEVSIKPTSKRQKKAFGLYFIAGNSVQHKRKTLRSFSLETQDGKLLKMFLDADGFFLSDEELLKAFKKMIIADISHILRNLKNAFSDNRLEIIIERRKNTKGYVLVDIQEMQ